MLGDGVSHFTPGTSVRTGSDTRYQHYGLKNIDAQSSSSQTISATRSYDAFGQTLGSSSSWSGPFGYGGAFGYQSEPDSGLQLLGHRYYDPSAGRFLSRDKARDGGNWYAYCGNSPLTNADPDGQTPVHLLYGAVLLGLVIYDLWDSANEAREFARKPTLLGFIFVVAGVVDKTPGNLLRSGGKKLFKNFADLKNSVSERIKGTYTVVTKDGAKYHGESGNVVDRIRRHNVDVDRTQPIQVREVEGPRINRRIEEQKEINKDRLENLENKINSIDPKYWKDLGIDP